MRFCSALKCHLPNEDQSSTWGVVTRIVQVEKGQFMMNVEDFKLINLDGEMLLKIDVILFILTDTD